MCYHRDHMPSSSQQAVHWADLQVRRLLKSKGDKERYVLASGITPSGSIHIGNFREAITVDFIRRALEKQGKQADFLFFWDDYDPFRKIPEGFSPKETAFLKNYLHRPLCDIPDPEGKYNSYAERYLRPVEKNLLEVGLSPQYRYQSEEYRSGRYTEKIKHALRERTTLISLLNAFRTSPLKKKLVPRHHLLRTLLQRRYPRHRLRRRVYARLPLSDLSKKIRAQLP